VRRYKNEWFVTSKDLFDNAVSFTRSRDGENEGRQIFEAGDAVRHATGEGGMRAVIRRSTEGWAVIEKITGYERLRRHD